MITGPFATAFYLEVSLPDHEYLSATHFPELSDDMNSDCQSGGCACGLLLSMYSCHHSKTEGTLINAELMVGPLTASTFSPRDMTSFTACDDIF